MSTYTQQLQRHLPLLAAVFLWALPLLPLAWPVDMEVVLKQGEAKFVKLAAAEWLEVDDTAVVSAELFDTQEILLEAKKPGVALLLVYAEKRAAVWRLVVEPPASSPATKPAAPKPLEAAPSPLQQAKHACPKLRFQPDRLPKITGHVDTEACRQALLFLLAQPGWLARELELVFEMEVLFAQLSAMQKAAEAALGKNKLTLQYVGATLEMSGRLSSKQHRQALWSVFFHAAGRIALNDNIQVLSPPKLTTPKEKTW